jgi:dephospho-CoA kinase
MRIVVTGGIGSGKSTVIDILKKFGKKTLSVDELNDELFQNSAYIRTLQQNFGTSDRSELRKIVFSSEKERQKLNELSHPKLAEKLAEKIMNARGDLFVEIPLLDEAFAEFFDEVWLVDADEDIKIKRVMERSNLSEKEVRAIMSTQTRIKNPTRTIINNSGRFELETQISQILSDFRCST